jgi:basic amino acid/polyamine antiporter, APA family
MFYLDVQTWTRLLVWLLVGFAIYFLYSRHHSNLAPPRGS